MESSESVDSGNDQEVGEEEEKDEIGEVLSEWKNHSEFKVRKFYRWLFPSALFSVYSLVAHTFLGVKYLNTGFILQSDNFTTDNPSCRNLTVEVLSNDSDWTDKRFYDESGHFYTCETQNLVFGIATLSVQFLPGIQWYTTLKVNENHRLGRFLSSLLFPFFSIMFKVAFKTIDLFQIFFLSLPTVSTKGQRQRRWNRRWPPVRSFSRQWFSFSCRQGWLSFATPYNGFQKLFLNIMLLQRWKNVWILGIYPC